MISRLSSSGLTGRSSNHRHGLLDARLRGHDEAVIPGRAEGAGPESITPVCEYGFRARRCAAPRNDSHFSAAARQSAAGP
jgi:hypothetical protein